MNIIKCRYTNCVPPPQPGLELPATTRPSTALFWSNQSHWSFATSGQPNENSDVFIPRNIWMVINQRLPRLKFLRIDGVLEFEQVNFVYYFFFPFPSLCSIKNMNNTLEVDNILINGGQLIVGSS